MMKCSKCGTDNPDGVKFCRECGASLLKAANQNRTKKIVWVFVIAAGVFIGLCLCVFAFVSMPLLIPKTSYDVRYDVASVGGASITYINANGGTEQENFPFNAWFREFKAASGMFLSVSAQTHGNFVGCIISVNGKVLSQSTGQNTIATCSGRLP